MANGVSFVERIDEELDFKGMKRAELLRLLGLPRNSISNWLERGNIPAGDICLKIADYFGVSIEYLITGKNNDSTQEERWLISQWKQLSDEQKSSIRLLLNGWEDARTKDEKNSLSKA